MRQQAQFQTTSTLAECFLAYIKQIPKQCTRQNHPSPHLALHPFLLLQLIGKTQSASLRVHNILFNKSLRSIILYDRIYRIYDTLSHRSGYQL